MLEGAYFRAPVEHPRDWPRDHLGAPTWFLERPDAAWGPWKRVVLGDKSNAIKHLQPPLLLPDLFSLVLAQRGESEAWAEFRDTILAEYFKAPTQRARLAISRAGLGRGRPGLAKTVPHTVTAAAWLRDGCGYTHEAVAAALGFGGNRRTARATGTRYIRAGQKLLNDAGVLPWTLWADGQVPGDWWRSTEFALAANLWYGYVVIARPRIRQFRRLVHEAANAQRAFEGKPLKQLPADLA